MTSLLVMVTAAALGVEAGWEPLPEGGHEYTIQIEPQLLELLKRGETAVTSEVPPELNVRRYRVVVGQGKLVRETGHATEVPATASAAPHRAPPVEMPSARAPAANDRQLDSLGEDTFREATPREPAAAPAEPRTARQTPAEPQRAVEEQPFGLPPVEEDAPPASEPAPADSTRTAEEPAAEPEPDFAPAEPIQDPTEAGSDPAVESPDPAVPGEPAPPDENSAELGLESTPPLAAVKPGERGTPRDQPGSIDQAAYAKAQRAETMNKPELPPAVPEKAKPWLPFLTSMFLLGCSIGGNIYLGWIAWDARHRYRNALSKFRAAPAG